MRHLYLFPSPLLQKHIISRTYFAKIYYFRLFSKYLLNNFVYFKTNFTLCDIIQTKMPEVENKMPNAEDKIPKAKSTTPILNINLLCHQKTSFSPHFSNKTTSVAVSYIQTIKPHYLIIKMR